MRSAISNEIEYLGDIEGATAKNPRLIREMAQRLDALRRFDQSFCEADCRPHATVATLASQIRPAKRCNLKSVRSILMHAAFSEGAQR